MSNSIDELSFEEGIKELETIVTKLESGNTTLEQSIADYSRGTAIKKQCETRLKDAELKVKQLIADSNGDITEKPLESL